MEINDTTLTPYAVYDLNGEYVGLVWGTQLDRCLNHDSVWLGNKCICVVCHGNGHIDKSLL